MFILIFGFIFFYFLLGLYFFLINIFDLIKNMLNKLLLVFCWLLFLCNVIFHYVSYCQSCFFSFDFFVVTLVWVITIYFFSLKNFGLIVNLVEERNFFIIFFIFVIESLSKLIQFFTILIRFMVNLIFGEIIKLFFIYNSLNFFFIIINLIEFFIIVIQSLIFFYIFFYYCEE